MKRKTIKDIINIISGLVLLFCAVVALKDFIPYSRTFFRSYESFLKQTEQYAYARRLPDSAKDVKYYCYEGIFREESCYHVSLSTKDYEMSKQERLDFYLQYEITGDEYRYQGGTKQYITLEQMAELKVDFLDKVILTGDVRGYYMLCNYKYSPSDMQKSDDTYIFKGVLCKDETCEMIEFSYYWP